MKKIVNCLANWISFRLIKYYFCFFLLIGSLSSCFQKFYTTNTKDTTNSATLKSLQSEGKIFIVHSTDADFVLNNPTVVGESFAGYADSLTPKLKNYLNPEADSANWIYRGQRDLVLNQVHLYANGIFIDHGKVNLDIGKIYRMDVYSPDALATKRSRTASIVGISIVVGVIVTMGAFAASSIAY
jgi:hypothetical protein